MADRKQPERASRTRTKRVTSNTNSAMDGGRDLDSEEPGTLQPGFQVTEAEDLAVPSTTPPDRRFLTNIGATRIYVSTGGARLLDLPMDALVIPVNVRLDSWGDFAHTVQEALGSGWDAFESGVISVLKSKGRLTPASPIPVSIRRQTGEPLTMFAGSAWAADFECDHQIGVEQAVRAILALCQRHSLRRVVIPLLGARGGSLPPVQVVRWILAAAQSALPAAPGIQELTVLAQEGEAYQEAITLFTRIPQRFANDVASGEDLLDVASEVQPSPISCSCSCAACSRRWRSASWAAGGRASRSPWT